MDLYCSQHPNPPLARVSTLRNFSNLHKSKMAITTIWWHRTLNMTFDIIYVEEYFCCLFQGFRMWGMQWKHWILFCDHRWWWSKMAAAKIWKGKAGAVLLINNIVAALGGRSLELLAMHAVTGCDIVSYPVNKEKLTALSKLREGNFPELCSWRGDGDARRLAENGSNILSRIAWPAKVRQFEYRQIHDLHEEERQPTTREVTASDGQKSAPSHPQNTPSNDIQEGHRKAGCSSNSHNWFWLGDVNNIPSPVTVSGLPAPPDLMKGISCQCRAAGKACTQGNCSCFAASLSCITYCRCTDSQDECHNPLTKKYDDDTSDDCYWHLSSKDLASLANCV